MNEETNIITNEIIEVEDNVTNNVVNVLEGIHLICSVLTFVIIIKFLYTYLKNTFPLKK